MSPLMTEDLLSRIKEALRALPTWARDTWEAAEDDDVFTVRTALDGDVDGDTGQHIVIGGELVASVPDVSLSDAIAEYLALLSPENVRALIGEVERLQTEVLNAAFSDRLDMEAGGSPLTWKEVAQAAEREVERLREALNRVSATLQVPAAEYVPAIPDAWEIIDAALGEAKPNPQQGKTL
jgi:hypothetical protein